MDSHYYSQSAVEVPGHAGIGNHAPEPTGPGLQRNAIGLQGTTATTLANIAPAMIVYLIGGSIVATMGSFAPWVFVLSGIAVLATGLSVVEFARRMTSAGGFISYVTRAAAVGQGGHVGKFLGAMTFYLLFLLYPLALASVLAFVGDWTTVYFDWPAESWIWVALVAVVASFPLALNGISMSIRTVLAMFIIETVPLLVLCVIVVARSHSAWATPFHLVGGSPGGFAGIAGLTFAVAVFGYIGWEGSIPLGEETKNPRRTIPRTVVLSIAVVTFIYVASSYVLVIGFSAWQGREAGMESIVAAGNPFLELAGHYAPWLLPIIFITGITSALGALLATSLTGARYIFHAARAGLLPRRLSRVSAKTGVPVLATATYVGLIVVATVMAYLILHDSVAISSFAAGISTVPMLVIYALTCALLPVFIWRSDRPAFSAFRHLLCPFVGFSVMAYGIWMSVDPRENNYWIFVLAYLAVAAAGAAFALRKKGPSIAALTQSLPDS
jgi:amino acid transporter